MKTLFAAILLSASAASAAPKGPPTIYGNIKPEVGAWAEYDVTTTGGKQDEKAVFKSSVVDKEDDGLWIEQKFQLLEPKPKKGEKGEQGGIMKMLIGKDRTAKRMLMQTPMGTMEMPVHPSEKKEAKEPKKGGKEKITTPAGTFEAQKLTVDDQTIWVKEGVGPYGMIKQVSKEGDETRTMVLKAYGKGAKAEVEVPAAAAGMKGMPPGMPAGMMPAGIADMMRKAQQKQQKKDEE